MRRFATLTLTLTTTAGLVMGCGSDGDDAESEAFEASGTVGLIGYSQDQALAAEGSTAGDPCQGAGSLAAFDSGVEVVVLDADGSKVAVGELSEGQLSAETEELAALGFSECEFTFSVPDVPKSDGIYTLQIDQSETSFSVDDATSIAVEVAGDEYP